MERKPVSENPMIILYILFLVLSAIGGILCCRKIVLSHGSYANVKVFIILNYILIQPISGILHLSGSSSGGFYDLLAGDSSEPLIATVNCILGLIALCIACMQAAVPDRKRNVGVHTLWLTRSETLVILVALVLITGPAWNALQSMNSYVEEVNVVRVISIDGGLARYGVIANWLVWIISFVALLLVGREVSPHPLVSLTVVSASVLLIVASLSWTGGRSIALLLAAPLILIMLPRVRTVGWLLFPIIVVFLFLNALTLAQTRSDALSTGQGVSIANWLEWEWGRFSLSGFASDYVEKNGLLYGETFWAGITDMVIGPLKLFGFLVPDLGLRASMEISGDELLGNSNRNHIVPGLNAELYLNFGLPGVLVGYYILGRIGGLVDIWISRAAGTLELFALLFIGVVLVLRTISADSGSVYYYIFYIGLPVLACTFVARLLQGRKRRPLKLAER
jgi:hypothetical protein